MSLLNRDRTVYFSHIVSDPESSPWKVEYKPGCIQNVGVEVTRIELPENAYLTLTKEKGLTTITYTKVEAEQLYDNEVAAAVAAAVLANVVTG